MRTIPLKKQKKTIENLKNELLNIGKKYNDLKGETDKVTQLLCYACGTLIDRDNMSGLDERLIKWWKDHNAWDKRRTLDTFKNQFGSNPDQRPTKDMAYEWSQHNIAYSLLPDDSEWKASAKDVDIDPPDQGKSVYQIFKDRIKE